MLNIASRSLFFHHVNGLQKVKQQISQKIATVKSTSLTPNKIFRSQQHELIAGPISATLQHFRQMLSVTKDLLQKLFEYFPFSLKYNSLSCVNH